MIRSSCRVPGGPFDANRKATPEVMANLNKAYHLDEPLYEQFGRYLWGVLQLDFGPSFKYRDYTVSELIFRGFPISLDIGLWAIGVAAYSASRSEHWRRSGRIPPSTMR
jgi:oligopeptide transport system permease protein